MKKIVFAIGITLSLLAKLYPAELLSWEQVLEETKEKNVQLKQAQMALQEIQLKLKKLKSEFYPQVTIGSAVNKNYTKSSESDISYSYNLSAGLPLFTGFSRVNNLKLQILELQIMQENYKRILSNVIAELKENFVNVYYLQELIVLCEKILQRRQQNYDLVRLKYETGREDYGSLLRVEADKLQAEYELNKAKRNYEVAIRKLLKTIGREKFTEIKVETNFSLNNDTDIILQQNDEELLLKIPEYKIKQYQLQKAEVQAKLAKSEFYPTVSFSVGYSLADTQPLPDVNKWNLSLGLKASYVIFNGFKNFYDLKIANVGIKTAQIELYDERLSLLNDLFLLKNNFVDLKESFVVRQKYLQALEKQAEIVSIKYVNGLASYYDWYQIEDSFITAQKNLLNLKRDIIIAEINLRKFLGLTQF